MRMPRAASGTVVCALLTWSHASRGDDTREVTPPRLTVAGVAGYAFLDRSVTGPSSRDGLALGGEVRAHPTSSAHGIVTTFLQAEGVFGPRVSIFDAAWSYRFVSGASGAGYFETGPTIAFVSAAPPAPDHRVLGGRVSLAFDGYLGPLLMGVTLGYRGGVPLGGPPDGWEGAFTSVARLGGTFEL